MGTYLLREQGLQQHSLAEQILAQAKAYQAQDPRKTPFMLYDTEVATQRSHYLYRSLRAEPSKRSIRDLQRLQKSGLPSRTDAAYMNDLRVAHLRPIVYKQPELLIVGSTRS